MKGIFKTIIFILLFTGWVARVHAQTEAHVCGTLSLPAHEKNALEKMMIQIMSQQSSNSVSGKNYKTTNTGTSCIPIKIHDIRDGAGAGSVNMTWLNQDLANLNYHFQASNIEFYFCGGISAVNNATHYDFLRTNESALLTAEPSVNNAFNLYLVNSIDGGASVAGYAYFPANLLISTVCIMDKSQLALDDNGTIVHEYGHHFNLYHTHDGTEDGNADPNAENVPRSGGSSNCTTKGDLLCDTHADPRGTYSGCTYTGVTTDILGNAYTPPMDNIMSYYPNQCGGFFTTGQNSRIIAARTVRSGHSAYSLTCAPTAVTAASALTAVQAGSAIGLTWTDNAANELGYLIERSTTSSSAGFVPLPMAGVAANTTVYTDNTIASNTTYWYRVKASNGSCNTYSNVATVTTGLIYCTPTYSAGGMCSNAIISNVTFTGNTIINNTTTQPNCLPAAYNDYSATISSAVTAGTSYNFSVTISAAYSRNLQLFIDYNQDGDFGDVGEKIIPDNTTVPLFPHIYSGSLTIPPTATNGITKMRVVLRNQVTIATACETNMSFGETEDYGLAISGGALPVELLSFSGKVVDEKILLNWSTAREIGNDHFELERSEEGNSFLAIGNINGAGNANDVMAYETIDVTPFHGKNFYRLKQINKNGTFSYSDIILINLLSKDYSVEISPNPATSFLMVRFETGKESLVSFEWQDITGRTLLSEKMASASGVNEKELSLQTLSPGVYFLRIKMDDRFNTFRIVKQ